MKDGNSIFSLYFHIVLQWTILGTLMMNIQYDNDNDQYILMICLVCRLFAASQLRGTWRIEKA